MLYRTTDIRNELWMGGDCFAASSIRTRPSALLPWFPAPQTATFQHEPELTIPCKRFNESMQRIARLEGAPYISNGRISPLDIPGYLSILHDSLDQDDARFPYYLSWLSEAASKSARSHTGPDSVDFLKEKLSDTDYGSGDFDEELLYEIAEEDPFSLSEYRFSMVFLLCKVYLELGEVSNAIDVVSEHQDEFRDNPLYGALRGEVLVEQASQESVNNALETVWRANEENPEWLEIQKAVADVITKVLERDQTYTGYNSEIPANPDELLEEAKDAIESATSQAHDFPDYLLIKGRIQTLDGRFDTARRTIQRAIEYLSPQRPSYERILVNMRIELSNVEIQEQSKILNEQTTRAANQLDDLKEDYRDATQEFQTRVLQFLGFFTGIIGIVVITGQVVISVGSPLAAIQLILALIGGLLFAFGGFSFVLPDHSGDITWRSFAPIISGGILIITSVILRLL